MRAGEGDKQDIFSRWRKLEKGERERIACVYHVIRVTHISTQEGLSTGDNRLSK